MSVEHAPPPAPASDWDRKRREILDAAAEVFFERGFERGTTKEIAERVGLSQPSIYHYVGNKRTLMAEIANQVSEDFTVALDKAERSSDDPVEQLRSVILAFTNALAVNLKTFAVYWKELNSIPEETAKPVKASQLSYVARVDQIVAACQRQGALPPRQPTHVLAEGILGMLSWMHWWYKPDGRLTPAQVADAFCDLIGLTPPAGVN
jgi:AcrR family transcriptional regulator